MVSVLVVSKKKSVTLRLGCPIIMAVLVLLATSHNTGGRRVQNGVEGFQQHIASVRHRTTPPSSSSLHLFSSGKEKKEKVANIDKFEYNFGGDDDGNDDDKDSSSLFSSFGNKKEKKESAAVVVVAADDSSSSLFSSFGNKKEEKKVETATPVVVVEEDTNDDNSLFGWTDFGTSNPISFVYGGAWLALLSLLAFGPGELNGPQDNALLQAIIANPAAPEGVNPFYYGIFNVFVLIPIVLGCTLAPRTNDEGIQAGTPIFLSAFIAYFVMGPYLALRKTPKTEFGVGDSLGWLTRNVWENKLFNWATVAFGFYALYAGAAPGLNDPATNFQGLLDFITTSRFASVSIADLSLITLILTKEVTDDYKIRCRGSTAENSKRAPFIGASTALLPVLGAAIYCALRPSLVADEDQF
mmetsp:Transcript_9478/g.10542  ORF Transcript_9478/g.10542 Transcript_9478/m.10542 type:complete len:412 (+) Transcript_9478:388-1623(+)